MPEFRVSIVETVRLTWSCFINAKDRATAETAVRELFGKFDGYRPPTHPGFELDDDETVDTDVEATRA